MSKDPAFQFYAQDFLTGVMYLTNEEIGIYIKMLSKQWTDGRIPRKRLGFLVGIEWDNFSDELKSKFKEDEDYLFNERLEQERDKRTSYIKKQVENGKKGGRPKKPKQNPSNKPNESQKKPLEDEIENENENENENYEINVSENEIIYAYDDELFKNSWSKWSKHWAEKNDRAVMSEMQRDAVMRRLSEFQNLEYAVYLIKSSIEKNYKHIGFDYFMSKQEFEENGNRKKEGFNISNFNPQALDAWVGEK